VGDKGYFVQPTVFADVKDDMKIAKEEVIFKLMLSCFLCYVLNVITLILNCSTDFWPRTTNIEI